MKAPPAETRNGQGFICRNWYPEETLKNGRILRAAIDVTEIEPIPLDDPLLTLDNLTIMPHIGSAVPETRRKMMAMAVDHLLMGLEGKRVSFCLNPEVYD